MAEFEKRVRQIGFHAYVKEVELDIINHFLAFDYDTRTLMANDLKMHRTTLIEKMRALGIQYEPFEKKAAG